MKYILLLTAALSLPLSARLGETLSECEKRYGEGAEVMEGSYVYQKGAYIIGCMFDEAGKVKIISYQSQGDGLTEKEITTFREVNKEKWINADSLSKEPGISAWVTLDGYLATYSEGEGILNIMTKASVKEISAQSEKALDGF